MLSVVLVLDTVREEGEGFDLSFCIPKHNLTRLNVFQNPVDLSSFSQPLLFLAQHVSTHLGYIKSISSNLNLNLFLSPPNIPNQTLALSDSICSQKRRKDHKHKRQKPIPRRLAPTSHSPRHSRRAFGSVVQSNSQSSTTNFARVAVASKTTIRFVESFGERGEVGRAVAFATVFEAGELGVGGLAEFEAGADSHGVVGGL